MTLTLQQAKEQVVKKYNLAMKSEPPYKDWDDMAERLWSKGLDWAISRMHEAAELYAEAKAKEAVNNLSLQIDELQKEYDENGFDFPTEIKLQRVIQHIEALGEIKAKELSDYTVTLQDEIIFHCEEKDKLEKQLALETRNANNFAAKCDEYRNMLNKAKAHGLKAEREAFEAAREKIDHPDWDYVYEDYETYKKQCSTNS